MDRPNLATVEDLLLGQDAIPVEGAYFHASSDDSEAWDGPFSSREEAIADAVNSDDYLDQADDETEVHTFWLGVGDVVNVTRSIDAERVIEHIDDALEGVVCFDAPWCEMANVKPEHEADLERRLRRAMAEWLTEHRLEAFVVNASERVSVPAEAARG